MSAKPTPGLAPEGPADAPAPGPAPEAGRDPSPGPPPQPAPEPPAEPWGQRKPRRGDVRNCYLYILGREPEDWDVIYRMLGMHETMDQLRAQFFRSEEFRRGFAAAVPPAAFAPEAPPMEIEAAAEEAEIERMLNLARRAWVRLGETEPHWSVRQEERFRPDRLAANRRAFLASGIEDRMLLEGVLARLRLSADRLPRLVEFGCGVGRATLHLAAICPEVTGIDISPPHLALAREEARARGLDHLRWLRARPEAPMPAEGYDVWFSRRALQHNPPPVMRRILALALAGLAPGGIAVFQLPTYGAGYRFSVAGHLAAYAGAAPEMHVLPQAEVFALAAAAGVAVLEVRDDAALPEALRGTWRSDLFVLRKPG